MLDVFAEVRAVLDELDFSQPENAERDALAGRIYKAERDMEVAYKGITSNLRILTNQYVDPPSTYTQPSLGNSRTPLLEVASNISMYHQRRSEVYEAKMLWQQRYGSTW